MGKLTDWIKSNAREGADISKAEMLIEKYSIDMIDSKEKALDFIKKNDFMSRGLDFFVQESVKNHDLKFQAESLPKLLKAKEEELKLKYNPPITETDKEVAELKAWKAEQTKANLVKEQETFLKGIAKEIEYPEDKASRFAIYGEQAESMLRDEKTFLDSHIKTALATEIKTRFGDNLEPKTTAPIAPADIDKDIKTARMNGDFNTANRLQLIKQQQQE